MGMGFFSWGWVGRILERGVNFFARGRGQIFLAKKGGKGVGKNFFAKNFLSLPVFLQSFRFFAVFCDFERFLAIFNGFQYIQN